MKYIATYERNYIRRLKHAHVLRSTLKAEGPKILILDPWASTIAAKNTTTKGGRHD